MSRDPRSVQELLDRVDATLAEPRPTGPLWRAPQPERAAPEHPSPTGKADAVAVSQRKFPGVPLDTIQYVEQTVHRVFEAVADGLSDVLRDSEAAMAKKWRREIAAEITRAVEQVRGEFATDAKTAVQKLIAAKTRVETHKDEVHQQLSAFRKELESFREHLDAPAKELASLRKENARLREQLLNAPSKAAAVGNGAGRVHLS